jgi:hypothetical protein
VSLPSGLVRLYPAAFRQRWGADLEIELQQAGRTAWLNLLVGIAAMWLRPATWPADSPVQRHQRMVTTAVALTAACWFAAHAAAELDTVADTWIMNACGALTASGLALLAPYPPLTFDAIARLLAHAARRLAVPAALGGIVSAAVHTGAYDAAPVSLRPVFFACWWTALAMGAFQSCRIVAYLGTVAAVLPSARRLRLGLWTLTAAGVLPAPILLGAGMTGPHPHLLSIASGTALLILLPAFTSTLRDLRGLPSAD